MFSPRHRLATSNVDCFTPYTLSTPEQNNNLLTSIPAGSFSNLASLQFLYLVRDAPRPALAPIYRSPRRVLLPTMRDVNDCFIPPHLPIPEQDSNRLTSIPVGSFSGLTSLKQLFLVRDAPRPALASIYLSPRRVPLHHAPCQQQLHSTHPPHPRAGI